MADMKGGTKGGGKTLKIHGADASLTGHMGKKKGGKKSKAMKLPGKK